MATVAVSRNRSLVARAARDPAVIRAYLERDRIFAAYAICDLGAEEFGRTRWGMAWQDDEPTAIAMEYSGPSPQPIFCMGEPDGIEAVLGEVIRPRLAYLAVATEALPAVQRVYRVDAAPPMVRMWVDRARFRPQPALTSRILPVEAGELNRLYQLGFASWLSSAAVSEGVYYGIRVGGRLVAAAGTHVINSRARLAVVGNVFTHADHRGRGYATAVTSAVTAELLRSCDQVVLNVRSDNPPAINAYRHLGYAEHMRFEERLVHRLGPPWAGLGQAVRRLFARKEN
jgi:ribosomal protein S18 acetylase RimI-like enzyme